MKPIPQPHCSLETVEVTLPLPPAHPGDSGNSPFPFATFLIRATATVELNQCGLAEPFQLICLQILDYGNFQ